MSSNDTPPEPKKRGLVPGRGDATTDEVYTPRWLARKVASHFPVSGLVMEPCLGAGSFAIELADKPEVDRVAVCNLVEPLVRLPMTGKVKGKIKQAGGDFLQWQPAATQRPDWVMTNPPWSLLLEFLKHSMTVANDVVFLCLVPAAFQKAKLRAAREAGFRMRKIVFLPEPRTPWPPAGFALGAVHWSRMTAAELKNPDKPYKVEMVYDQETDTLEYEPEFGYPPITGKVRARKKL